MKIFALILKILLIPQLVYFGVVALLAFSLNWITPTAGTLMTLRAVGGTKIQQPRFVPLSDITPATRQAFVYLEDHDFYQHWGFNLRAIRDAWNLNSQAGADLYGGSTITQQLSRTLFLYPNKDYFRKYLELGTSVILEFALSKDRILELYLNSIEWGPGVFGIGAAAQYHYKTKYQNLTLDQRYRLASIITSPVRFSVKTMQKSPGIMARYRALLNR